MVYIKNWFSLCGTVGITFSVYLTTSDPSVA